MAAEKNDKVNRGRKNLSRGLGPWNVLKTPKNALQKR